MLGYFRLRPKLRSHLIRYYPRPADSISQSVGPSVGLFFGLSTIFEKNLIQLNMVSGCLKCVGELRGTLGGS